VIITEFHVDRFLNGSPLKLLDLGQGLNVALVDRRESKRELLNLVPWVLFGRTLSRGKRRRGNESGSPAWSPSGGTILLRTENGVFRVSRRPQDSVDADHRPLLITAPDGTQYEEDFLDTLLDSVTFDQYQQWFTLSPKRLRRIAENRDEFAYEYLAEIARELSEQSPSVVTEVALPDVSVGWLTDMKRSLSELRGTIARSRVNDQSSEESPTQPKWNSVELNDELRRTETELKDVQAKDQHLEDEIEAVKGALNYNRTHLRLEEIQQELSKLRQESACKPLELAKHRPLMRLDARIKTCRDKLQKVKLEGREFSQQLREDSAARRGIKLMPRIEAMLFQERMFLAEEEAVDQLATRIREIETRLESERFQLSSPAGKPLTSQRPDLPSSGELQRLAQHVKQAKHDFQRAKATLTDTESTARDISPATPQLSATELRPLHDSRERVERLRRQLDHHSQYHELASQRRDLDVQVRRLYSNQLMPFRMTTIFAIPFTIGVGMVIYNLTRASGEHSFSYVLMGFALATVVAVVKLVLDYSGHNTLQVARRRLSRVESNLQGITEGFDEDELENLTSRDSLVEKLRIAEKKMEAVNASLRDHQPVAPIVDSIETLPEVIAARQRLDEKQFSYRESMSNWRRFLVEAGLSPKLSPSQARIELAQLSSAQSPIAQGVDFGNDLSLRHMRGDLDRRRNNLENVADVLRSLLQDLGFSGSSRTIREQLDILREVLEEKKSQLRQRRRGQRSLKKLQRRRNKISDLGRRLSQLRKQMVERIEKKQDERKINHRIHSQRVRMLQQEQEHMQARIDELSERYSEDERAPVLGEMTDEQLEERLEHHRQQQSEIRDQLIGHAEKRGRLRERIKELDAPRSDNRPQFAWDEIEQRLADVVQHHKLGKTQVTDWREMLKRHAYSRTVPKYLELAAVHLANLSRQKFVSFDYVIRKKRLSLRDKDGELHSLDKLSGEQLVDVYLSLWLARIDALADRGVNLPIVINDLLETTGDKKDRRLAKALTNCAARGHQFLSATVDLHHAKEFAKLEVPIANLAERIRDEIVSEPADGSTETWRVDQAEEPRSLDGGGQGHSDPRFRERTTQRVVRRGLDWDDAQHA